MSKRAEAEAIVAAWADKNLQKEEKLSDVQNGIARTEAELYPDLTLYTYPENHKAFKGVYDKSIIHDNHYRMERGQ